MVLYFAGFQQHYSIYPASSHLVSALKKELAGFLHSKATIRFPVTDAVPTRLIARIAKLRAAEAAEVSKARRTKRAAPKRARSKTRKKGTRSGARNR